MTMIKKVFFIVFALIFCLYSYAEDRTNNLGGDNELINLILESNEDANIKAVILAYAEFGFLEKIFPLIERIENKYDILRFILEKNRSLNVEILEKIKGYISGITDINYKNYLLLELGVAYAGIGKTKEARKIFSDIFEEYKAEKDYYQRAMNIITPDGLSSSLIKAAFFKQAEEVLCKAQH